MTSYFEKLTSINTSSLNLQSLKQQNNGSGAKTELSVALDKIEELKGVNSKLELDLKCEHDEKADLVGLKVGLENQVLNLREVNDRLEFQVEQLRVEKDKIHNALAKIKEDILGGVNNIGGMKKFPSLDDLSSAAAASQCSPCSSPTLTQMTRVCTTPTSSAPPLERITEEDENLLESLQMGANGGSGNKALQEQKQNNAEHLDELLKRIEWLEKENQRLKSNLLVEKQSSSSSVCSKCKRSSMRSVVGGIRDHHPHESDHDEGLDVEDGDEDEVGFGVGDNSNKEGASSSGAEESHEGVEDEINVILEMQRKIIEKLETELNSILQEDDASLLSSHVNKLKIELEQKMNGIIKIATNKINFTNSNHTNAAAADDTSTNDRDFIDTLRDHHLRGDDIAHSTH